MSIRHHPHYETLARYAAGSLAAGPRVVVATHVEGCAHCRDLVASFEAVGGALLDDLPPAELSDGAFARLMASIDRGDTSAVPPPRPKLSPIDLPAGFTLPRALLECEIGRWRWMGPGIRYSRITVPDDPSADLMMLRVAPGKKLPDHGHTGTEFTQILYGSYADENGHYRPGDMSEADSEVDHQPVVERGGECICLAAMEGRMRLNGFFGRLIQPLLGG